MLHFDWFLELSMNVTIDDEGLESPIVEYEFVISISSDVSQQDVAERLNWRWVFEAVDKYSFRGLFT